MNQKLTTSAWVLLGSVISIAFLEYRKDRSVCTIKGEIFPAMALRKIWVIQDGDTIPTSCISNTFKVVVKPGPYLVWIDAVAPFQDFRYTNFATGEQAEIELGNIQLVQ